MNRKAALANLLERYGQTVDLHPGGQKGTLTVKAFLQPVLEKNRTQYLTTAVGARRQDRFLYLGTPEIPLSSGDGSWVDWDGRRYEIESAQAIYVGESISHWWAVLRPGEEEV